MGSLSLFVLVVLLIVVSNAAEAVVAKPPVVAFLSSSSSQRSTRYNNNRHAPNEAACRIKRIYSSTVSNEQEESSICTTGSTSVVPVAAPEDDKNNIENPPPIVTQQENDSVALQSILGEDMSEQDFFETYWQTQPYVFSFSSITLDGDGTFDEQKMRSAPLQELTRQAWHVVTDLLERAVTETNAPEPPLVLKDRQVLNREECYKLYGSSLLSPYLDGCSIVQNHADLISPWIAQFCNLLQTDFPHVYANTYLTPPHAQAMNPHADDRDVFVIQLYGQKHWQVFDKVPIPYPYPHEQVGKNGLEVPLEVLEGPKSINQTLQPGNVLYIPRGHVHQAQCSHEPSFHITIAIATFDWTLAGMMNLATTSILTNVQEYRKSIVPTLQKKDLQFQIDEALELLQREITAESVLANLHHRIEAHVQRSAPIRAKQIQRAKRQQWESTTTTINGAVVGSQAAQSITLQTIVRGTTQEDKQDVNTQQEQQDQLFIVRPELEHDLYIMLQQFEADPTLECRVSELASLLPPNSRNDKMWCDDLTLLGVAQRAVELGKLAIVVE